MHVRRCGRLGDKQNQALQHCSPELRTTIIKSIKSIKIMTHGMFIKKIGHLDGDPAGEVFVAVEEAGCPVQGVPSVI